MSSKSSVLADVQSAAAAKSLISPAPISPRYAETGNPTIRIEIHPSHPACSGLPPIHASTTAVRPSRTAVFDGSHAAAAANEKTNAFNECHDASFGRKIRSGKRRWSKACRLDDPVSRRHRCHTGCSRSCLL